MEESGLFELIKTLGKSEKRYFKKYASVHAGKTTPYAISLFEALEEPEEYNDKAFRKDNSKKKFFRNLASEKQHLMKLLLQSLNEYHRNHGSRSSIHFHLDSFELLFEKRQYRLCAKHLSKAAKLSRRSENYIYLPLIYRSFGKLYQHSGNNDKLGEMLRELEKDLHFITARVENSLFLTLAEYKFFHTSRRLGYPRNDEARHVYEELYRKATLLPHKTETLQENLTKLLIDNFYLDTKPDKNPLMRARENWIHLAETDPLYIADNSMQYLVSLNNIANSYDELGMKEDLDRTLEKIMLYPKNNLDEEVRTFIYYYNLKMVGPIVEGDFKTCVAHFPAAQAGMKKLGRWFHPEYKLSFRYLFAYGNFGAGLLQQSLKWTHEIINNYPKETLEEYYNFARVFLLIIYYELGYEGPLTSELRSANRYFSKREKLFPLEKSILTFIKASLKPEGIQSSRKEMELLQKDIRLLKDNPYDTQLFSLFDWEAWAESKMLGITFSEAIKRRSATTRS